MVVGGHRHAPAALLLWKRSGTLCTEGWVGPRADLDGCGNFRRLPGFKPQTVRPVTSRCTNYDLPAYLVGRTACKMPMYIVVLSIYIFHLHNFNSHFWFITLVFSSRFLNFDALNPSSVFASSSHAFVIPYYLQWLFLTRSVWKVLPLHFI